MAGVDSFSLESTSGSQSQGLWGRPQWSVPTRGSINGLGTDFQPFGMNDLELLDLRFGGWNPVASWLKRVDTLFTAGPGAPVPARGSRVKGGR